MKIAIAHSDVAVIGYLLQQLQPIALWTIAWVVQDGLQAVKYGVEEPVDLLLLDVAIEGVGSMEVTRRLAGQGDVAILLLASDEEPRAGQVFEVMGAGALDVAILSPRRHITDQQRNEDFIRKINTIATLKGKARQPLHPAKEGERSTMPGAAAPSFPLLLFGASTGGPLALMNILSALPAALPAAIVIIQHLDEKFIPALAQWLAQKSSLPIRLAEEGMRPQSGAVLIAAKNEHLVLTGAGTLKYMPAAPNDTYCPSIDIFFNSAARHWRQRSLAVLLSGMGNDGAVGLKNLRQCGWHTIAEDEKSCAIFGMPRAAIALDAALQIVEQKLMAKAILEALGYSGE